MSEIETPLFPRTMQRAVFLIGILALAFWGWKNIPSLLISLLPTEYTFQEQGRDFLMSRTGIQLFDNNQHLFLKDISLYEKGTREHPIISFKAVHIKAEEFFPFSLKVTSDVLGGNLKCNLNQRASFSFEAIKVSCSFSQISIGELKLSDLRNLNLQGRLTAKIKALANSKTLTNAEFNVLVDSLEVDIARALGTSLALPKLAPANVELDFKFEDPQNISISAFKTISEDGKVLGDGKVSVITSAQPKISLNGEYELLGPNKAQLLQWLMLINNGKEPQNSGSFSVQGSLRSPTISLE